MGPIICIFHNTGSLENESYFLALLGFSIKREEEKMILLNTYFGYNQ